MAVFAFQFPRFYATISCVFCLPYWRPVKLIAGIPAVAKQFLKASYCQCSSGCKKSDTAEASQKSWDCFVCQTHQLKKHLNCMFVKRCTCIQCTLHQGSLQRRAVNKPDVVIVGAVQGTSNPFIKGCRHLSKDLVNPGQPGQKWYLQVTQCLIAGKKCQEMQERVIIAHMGVQTRFRWKSGRYLLPCLRPSSLSKRRTTKLDLGCFLDRVFTCLTKTGQATGKY